MESPIVQSLLRRFRSPLVAIVAIVFSAGIAMAAQPAGNAATGLATAASHAGKTVPVQATDEQSGDQDESTDSTDPSSSESSDHCTVDLTQDPSVLAGLNHGSVVCTAAQQDTPQGYDNHGAWVSHWAKMNKGADASATGQGHKPSH